MSDPKRFKLKTFTHFWVSVARAFHTPAEAQPFKTEFEERWSRELDGKEARFFVSRAIKELSAEQLHGEPITYANALARQPHKAHASRHAVPAESTGQQTDSDTASGTSRPLSAHNFEHMMAGYDSTLHLPHTHLEDDGQLRRKLHEVHMNQRSYSLSKVPVQYHPRPRSMFRSSRRPFA
ncbi:hypothetical protein JCM10207_006529 [Rhodosporidiobolus poonsookiae]